MNKRKQARRERALARLKESYALWVHPSRMDEWRMLSEINTLEKRLGVKQTMRRQERAVSLVSLHEAMVIDY